MCALPTAADHLMNDTRNEPEIPAASALDTLQAELGYRFRDPALLRAALVHTSYVNERGDVAPESNERLEFLGDAVLSLVVAHRLYERRPESEEGDLTVLRAWLVRQSTLARWAQSLRLGEYLLLGRGEARSGSRERGAILARTFEAVLGAIYLDGGSEGVRQVVLPRMDRELAGGSTPQKVVDAKSRLQQVTQAKFDATPEYQLVESTGPSHAPAFTFQVQAGPDVTARGTGYSKRAAQQVAAHAALKELGVTEGYEVPEEDEQLP